MLIIGSMKMESQAFSPVECSLRPVDVVVLKNCVASRRLSMIVAQQPTRPLPTHHRSCLATNFWLWRNQMVTKTLMITLGMIVLQVMRQNISAATPHLT